MKFMELNGCSEALKLRNEVFTIEQGFAIEDDIDEYDNVCRHFAIKMDDKIVAVLRVLKQKDSYKIGRFAVKKQFRKKGIGSYLLQNIFTIFNDKDIILGSQLGAIKFYQANGFEEYGALFDDAGAPHQMMKRVLK